MVLSSVDVEVGDVEMIDGELCLPVRLQSVTVGLPGGLSAVFNGQQNGAWPCRVYRTDALRG